jgi:hypothetical protein
MNNDASKDKFGCEQCWPESADAAWEAIQKTSYGDDLIDESHWHVMIRVCPACSQHFLWVSTEKIDWADGDDPQHWAVLPLTEAEIKTHSYSLSFDASAPLQPDRRSLQADFPKGDGARIYWSTGIFIGDHD